jgi:enoyl-CoA hydratase/carnithine racemase
LTAQRALDAGLVNEVVPTGQSVERALEIAGRMARHSQSYLQYHKRRFFESLGVPIDYALTQEQRGAPGAGERP